MSSSKDPIADGRVPDGVQDPISTAASGAQTGNTPTGMSPASEHIYPEPGTAPDSMPDANASASDLDAEMSALAELEALYGCSQSTETDELSAAPGADFPSIDDPSNAAAFEDTGYWDAELDDAVNEAIADDFSGDGFPDDAATLEELESLLDETAIGADDGSDALADLDTGADGLPVSEMPCREEDELALDTDALIAEMNELLQASAIGGSEDETLLDAVNTDGISGPGPNLDDLEEPIGEQLQSPEPVVEYPEMEPATEDTDNASVLQALESNTAETPERTIAGIAAYAETAGQRIDPHASAVDALAELEAMAGVSADSEDCQAAILSNGDGDGHGIPPATSSQKKADQDGRAPEDYERLDDDEVVIIRKDSSAWNDKVIVDSAVDQTSGARRVTLLAVSVAASVAAAAVLFWNLRGTEGESAAHHASMAASAPAATAKAARARPAQVQAAVADGTSANGRANLEAGPGSAIVATTDHQPQHVQDSPVYESNIDGYDVQNEILALAQMASEYAADGPDGRGQPYSNSRPDSGIADFDKAAGAVAVVGASGATERRVLDLQQESRSRIDLLMQQISEVESSISRRYEEKPSRNDAEIQQLQAELARLTEQLAQVQQVVDARAQHPAASPDQAMPPERVMATAAYRAPQAATLEQEDNRVRNVWFVHLASYYGKPPPERELEYLDKADVPYEIRSTVVDGSTWYRVLVSNFTAYRDARAYSETLKTHLGENRIWISKSRL